MDMNINPVFVVLFSFEHGVAGHGTVGRIFEAKGKAWVSKLEILMGSWRI